MWMTSYTNAVSPYYMARRARGTPGAPTAVQNGDGLAGFYGEGYGTSIWSGFAGGMTVQAAQNWTNTAHGTALHVHDHFDQCDCPSNPDDHRL